MATCAPENKSHCFLLPLQVVGDINRAPTPPPFLVKQRLAHQNAHSLRQFAFVPAHVHRVCIRPKNQELSAVIPNAKKTESKI
jgi:hypothetical protein